MHVLDNKKNDWEEGVQPGQKKNKKKNKKGKGKAQPEDTKLTLTIETLGYFDSIKVSAPVYAKDIDEVSKQLTEKREYFIKVSDELNEGKKPEEVEPEKKEEEKTEDDAKPVEKKGKKPKVSLDDDEMFPAMGGSN